MNHDRTNEYSWLTFCEVDFLLGLFCIPEQNQPIQVDFHGAADKCN